MKTKDFFFFIVLQFVIRRGQTSVLSSIKRASFVTSTESATLDTSYQGCEYNGKQYNHTERLPGCFKVYCIQGKWLQEGYIDWNCMFCSAYWDPHLVTFDRSFYDFQGPCEYALAQEGTSRRPRYAVNTKFIECSGGASCVGPSTFKDSEKTLIEMGAFGWGVPDLFKLKVNGVLYEVPDSIPRLVKEGGKEQPVFAWRYNNCIRLLGSSKIAVEKCGSSLAIWASPEFHGSLFGLCGFYDGYIANDFTRRDGTASPVEQFSTDFTSSWEVSCPRTIIQNETKSTGMDENCTLDEKLKEELSNRCNETVGPTHGLLTEAMIAVLMENCIFDLCAIFKNTSGNFDAIKSWLDEIETSITEISDAANKITGTDILPEPVKDNQPEPSANETGINSDSGLVKIVFTGSTKNLTNSSINNSPKPAEDDNQEVMTNRTGISNESDIPSAAVSPGPNRNLPDSGKDKLPEPVEDEQKATTNEIGIPSDFDIPDAAVSTRSDTHSDSNVLQNPAEDEVDVMNNGTGISTESLTPLPPALPGANRNLSLSSGDNSPQPVEDELEPTTNRTGIHSDLDTSDAAASAGSNKNFSDSSRDGLPDHVEEEMESTAIGTGIRSNFDIPDAAVPTGSNRNIPDSSKDNSPVTVKDDGPEATTDRSRIIDIVLTGSNLPNSSKPFDIWRIVINIIHGRFDDN
ncbi:uncharacterized protein [Palaemon carinicauda]|uniref:uncharacterized protein isoform X2 n=1 Tax=Palaemon carinicauda TaxID=392227 RepID=UPI0035B5786B